MSGRPGRLRRSWQEDTTMQKITTFLTFNDQAEQAVKFYTSVFKNSKITETTRYGDTGPGAKGSVMTIAFELDGQPFVALNGGSSFSFSQGISLLVNCETQAEVDDYWAKLSAGGKEVACGWVTDKFGVSWQVVPTILLKMIADKDRARADRAMEAMMKMVKIDIATLKRAYESA
jgi:predicted 3-demethylubiquinone-9 3-methyltransferase (glyoxalase superfamily)